MPPKTLFRLGLSLLFIALSIDFTAGYWLRSRIFTPLEYPVSLDSRQLKSPPFQINLRETYFISLHLDYSVDDWYEDGRCNQRNVLGSKWRVYQVNPNPGQPRALWASSDELTGPYLYYAGAFTGSSGQYELEWDLPASAACLNPRHPRLEVFTSPYGYQEAVGFTQFLCIFLGGTGVALVALAMARVMQLTILPAAAPRIFPDMVLRNVLPFKRHRSLLPIHDPPHLGLFFGAVLWILMFIFMTIAPFPPHGLFVSIGNREFMAGEKSPWPETLAIYVRKPSRFFINGEEVERGNLRAMLLDRLSRRVPWTVYFEADSDITYMDAVYAIDTIQGCGAKLIWITPKMRKEWRHKEQSARHIP